MKKIISLIMILLVFSLLSCDKETTKETDIKINTSSISKETRSQTTKYEIKYKDYDYIHNLSYGEFGNYNLYDLYLPKDIDSYDSLNVVLFIHGGAWISGDKESYKSLNDLFGKFLMGEFGNCVLASIDYRLLNTTVSSPTIFNMIEDITSSINAIKKYIENLGKTATNLILGGHSAGAHLALLYSYKYEDSSSLPIKFVYSLSGPTNINMTTYGPVLELLVSQYPQMVDPSLNYKEQFVKNAMGESDYSIAEKELSNVSPISFVSNAVPTLICHGNNDLIVPYTESKVLIEDLLKNNIKSKLITIDKGVHTDTSLYMNLKNSGFLLDFIEYYNSLILK